MKWRYFGGRGDNVNSGTLFSRKSSTSWDPVPNMTYSNDYWVSRSFVTSLVPNGTYDYTSIYPRMVDNRFVSMELGSRSNANSISSLRSDDAIYYYTFNPEINQWEGDSTKKNPVTNSDIPVRVATPQGSKEVYYTTNTIHALTNSWHFSTNWNYMQLNDLYGRKNAWTHLRSINKGVTWEKNHPAGVSNFVVRVCSDDLLIGFSFPADYSNTYMASGSLSEHSTYYTSQDSGDTWQGPFVLPNKMLYYNDYPAGVFPKYPSPYWNSLGQIMVEEPFWKTRVDLYFMTTTGGEVFMTATRAYYTSPGENYTSRQYKVSVGPTGELSFDDMTKWATLKSDSTKYVPYVWRTCYRSLNATMFSYQSHTSQLNTTDGNTWWIKWDGMDSLRSVSLPPSNADWCGLATDGFLNGRTMVAVSATLGPSVSTLPSRPGIPTAYNSSISRTITMSSNFSSLKTYTSIPSE